MVCYSIVAQCLCLLNTQIQTLWNKTIIDLSMSDNWTMVAALSKDLVACLTKVTAKACISICVPSPFLRPLLCGVVSPYYFRLRNNSIFILREGVAICRYKAK